MDRSWDRYFVLYIGRIVSDKRAELTTRSHDEKACLFGICVRSFVCLPQ
jgi:hypothetical protein